MPRRRRIIGAVSLLVVAGAAIGGWMWLRSGLEPGGNAKTILLRIPKSTSLDRALENLEAKGVVKNARALRLWAKFRRRDSIVGEGTYRFPAMVNGEGALDALEKPIRQMVRIPETNWAARTARLLEKKDVCDAEEYMSLVRNPGEFAQTVTFPLPKDSLEGYLFPDTYDLPPLIGAREVIERQLKAFERKVWEPLGKPKNLARIVTIASMVEMEVMKHNERPMVAGVIENRLKKNMRLQIDATINYGIQKWRPLTRADYREVDSPYNTYRVDGLPPGPICSPSLRSIEGAVKPASHNYLYYVAMPDGHHLFSADYPTHLKNIEKRRAAIREEGG